MVGRGFQLALGLPQGGFLGLVHLFGLILAQAAAQAGKVGLHAGFLVLVQLLFALGKCLVHLISQHLGLIVQVQTLLAAAVFGFIGGGVCQVSSTLYNAVVFAGLKSTERHAHSYEPSYVTPGEDAAVSYGGPDFKFVNNSEYPLAIKRLRTAIAQAEEMGLLGEHIFESDFSFTIHIKEGAGAFVCGEETALMASIEGKRGMPRVKPPRTVEQGLWARPTVLNNVETYANVPQIILRGSAWFHSIGTEKSPGTKAFALTGNVVNTGLIEVPMGATLREIIFDIGGGIKDGKKFKAVQTGGPAGGCLTEEQLDLPVDFDSLKRAGAIMGSGGLVVMDEDTCMVETARFFMNFTQSESCGKCVPCREGTKRMLEILTRIVNNEGTLADLDMLETLSQTITQTALCGLGQAACNPVVSTLRHFRSEYLAHVVDHHCPICNGPKAHLAIDPEKCKGCGKCKKNCPMDAISGEKKKPHTIDTAKCIRCGACQEGCPFDAIELVKEEA